MLTPALAEDIDIYMMGEYQKPAVNVIVIVDNSANWGSTTDWPATTLCGNKAEAFCHVKEALINTLADVDIEGLSIGLMLFSENESVRGYPRYAVRPMGLTGTNNKNDLVSLVTSLDINGDKGSNAAFGMALYEAYLYFQGKTPAHTLSATPKSDQGIVTLGDDSTIDKADGGAFNGSLYKQILQPEGECNVGNYIIFISNGPPASGEDSAAETALSAIGGNTTLIPLTPKNYESNWADEWARFLYGSSGIQLFTVDVAPGKVLSDEALSELLRSMARQSNGVYFRAESADVLASSMKEAFDQIQIANSVFAPTALPASSENRAIALNQVYMGLFRPDRNPRWFGNLKLYQFGLNDTGVLELVDSTGTVPVKDTASGIIADGATSFWTHSSTFWNYRCVGPDGNPLAFGDTTLCGDPVSGSDSPDGAVVEKGAGGQQLRDDGAAARVVYTCIGCAGQTGTLSAFNSANAGITESALGAVDSTERAAIIDWMRGVDNISENTAAGGGSRPSMPGDVLHTQPVAVNYNTSATGCADSANLDTDLVAFYAGNDGMLHALQGGTSGTAAGKELWSFMPDDFFGSLKRLRDNAPSIIFPAPVPAGERNKPYLLDGSLSVYAPDDNDDCKPDKVWLFMTMRRGGRAIYALDVTDSNAPIFKWKISNTSTGFSELGQTWSAATPVKLPNGTEALLFGAGYDPGFEDRAFDTSAKTYGNPPSAKAMGRGIYLVNADTGALLQHFGGSYGMTDAIPSDITVLSRPPRVARIAYVGDTGGNLWRINFTDDPISDPYSVTKIASLGDPSDSDKTGAYARKFLYPPNVVTAESGGYAILIGSGDRSKPFDTLVENRFYMVKDTGSGASPGASCTGNETSCNLTDVTTLGTAVPSDSKGWLIQLAAGEKTVGGAATTGGVTIFATNQPSTGAGDSCAINLGLSRLYAVDYATGDLPDADKQPGLAAQFGESRSIQVASGGFPPTPQPFTVEIPDPANPGDTLIESGVISGIDVIHAVPTPQPPGVVFWYDADHD
ncbi:hypothetical protein F2Q65_02910 [Thiohalocapsa marina]|uniref:VWFA domain-containing protein n=1 Tax=Thiohalocapsa marina TaxID=424902 RepID=A0A5M8FUH2_9GAMM|nr:PilC/PilY family type IV pilus protein [Thiohalocapsa marina]KAA6187478.1 hypothetical protein F2Q65_02910 [Thiohalocapsa marina]